MRYLEYRHDGPELHLYPLSDWHVGAKQFSEPFALSLIKRIKADPLARWFYMGDGGECNTLHSKGNVYEQLLTPGQQITKLVEYWTPIKNKGLFGIRGNHGHRIDKETGLGWDKTLCDRIGIPYAGVAAFLWVVLRGTKAIKQVDTKSRSECIGISLYCHHGVGGAATPGGRVTAGRKGAGLAVADIFLSGHSHSCGEVGDPLHLAYIDPLRGGSRNNGGIRWRTLRFFTTGSAYDSRSGYNEEHMRPVLLPQHIMLKLISMRQRVKGKWEKIRVAVDWKRFEGYAPEFAPQMELEKWEE